MTPKLRFPEFTRDWHKILLGDLLAFKNGLNADKSRYGSGTKYISVSDIIDNRYITHENIKGSVATSSDEIKKNLVSFGDILFQRSSETREEVGQVNIYIGSQPVIFGGFVIRGHAKLDYEPYFMNYLLRTPSIRKEITNRSGGSTHYNIGQDSLEKVPILTTSFDEQHRIAGFLTVVDDKSASIHKKITLLKKYRKSVMQKIFSQEIRFKDDNESDYPDWTYKDLEDVLNIENGFPFKSVYFNDRGQGAPLIRIRDLRAEHLETYFAGEYEDQYLVRNKDILIGMDGSFNLVRWNLGEALLNQRVLRLKAKPDNALEYLAYFIETKLEEIERKTPRTTVKHLSNKDIFRVHAAIPSYGEQQKIADFLEVIDNKVRIEEAKLENTVKFKNSLLQKMFI